MENIQIFGDPTRILPALIASEQAMPTNYIASLRLAEMENSAKHYDEAIAACDRGLARSPGSNGRAWLLRIKADALRQNGQTADARRALQEALVAARVIPNQRVREMNLAKLSKALKEIEEATK